MFVGILLAVEPLFTIILMKGLRERWGGLAEFVMLVVRDGPGRRVMNGDACDTDATRVRIPPFRKCRVQALILA